jgi:large repetitive protein
LVAVQPGSLPRTVRLKRRQLRGRDLVRRPVTCRWSVRAGSRVWFAVLGGLVMASLAGCGRHGLAQAGRDAAGLADGPLGPTDAAIVPEARVPDALPNGGLDGPGMSVCGNLVLEPGEDCEDGNLLAGDGCDPACHYEPWLNSRCGNGSLDSSEGCDDGNRISGDGCSSECCMEGCWACTDGCIDASRRPCHCGNGMLERFEQCDDGNLIPGDGCNQYCTIELPTCGNGVLDPGEECDDGNRIKGDRCDPACYYDPPSHGCSPHGYACADGKVSPGETCDDGNVFPGDGCSATCGLEPGYYCPTAGEPCLLGSSPVLPVFPELCGDGKRDPGEACDDGINDGSYGSCNPDCSAAPYCGDGIVQPEREVCDLGDQNTGAYGGCTRDCKPGPYCGDGKIDGGEECDPPGGLCDTACRFVLPRK